jgi:glutamine amidotransferase
MNKNVVIIDYGIGNVKSILNAFLKIGARPIISSDEKVIMSADALILPGVGAFQTGMLNLERANLIPIIYSFISSGKPILGICLGMQLLFDESDEFIKTKGLGIIEGSVKSLNSMSKSSLKLPHVGWNEIAEPENGKWSNSILESTKFNSDVYFVHSFAAVPHKNKDILATSNYLGIDFCAAVKKDNIFGVQFHPEKSGIIGLKMLSDFLKNKI